MKKQKIQKIFWSRNTFPPNRWRNFELHYPDISPGHKKSRNTFPPNRWRNKSIERRYYAYHRSLEIPFHQIGGEILDREGTLLSPLIRGVSKYLSTKQVEKFLNKDGYLKCSYKNVSKYLSTKQVEKFWAIPGSLNDVNKCVSKYLSTKQVEK